MADLPPLTTRVTVLGERVMGPSTGGLSREIGSYRTSSTGCKLVSWVSSLGLGPPAFVLVSGLGLSLQSRSGTHVSFTLGSHVQG